MQNLRRFITPIGIFHRKCSTKAPPELLSEVKRRAFRKNPKHVKLVMDCFKFSNARAHRFLNKYPDFCTIDPMDAQNSFNYLRTLDISIEEIQENYSLLGLHIITLTNRHQILLETGFKTVQIEHLRKYLQICRQSIDRLLLYNFIDPEKTVAESLLASFELEPASLTFDHKKTLEIARKIALDAYIKRNLEFSDANAQVVWSSYERIKHKSAASILKMVKTIKKELGYTNKQIQKNSFILGGDGDHLKEVIRRFRTIGDLDTRELLLSRPKLCMMNPDTLASTLDVLRRFNIPHSHIVHCPDVLTLGPQTIENRLKDLSSIKEFDGLIEHPRVLKLVMYQIKAKARMEFLSHLKFKCASLHILSTSNVNFEKYAREGADKTSGNDCSLLMSHLFGKTVEEVKEVFGRHPNWRYVPLATIKSNLDYLLKEKFKKPDIYKHIYLLSYPMARIKEKLEFVRGDKSHATATKSQILSLILYYIEMDFHFTGDGMWADSDVPPMSSEISEQGPDMLSINLVQFGRTEVDKAFPTREYNTWGYNSKMNKKSKN